MQITSVSELDGVRARVALDFFGLVVASQEPFFSSSLSSDSFEDGECGRERKASSGRYLDVAPVISTLAGLEELITVLGAPNVFIVVYGKSSQRVKNYIDFRNIWSLGLCKENVILCPDALEIGALLQSKNISVYFSTLPEAITSAAKSMAPPCAIPSSPGAPLPPHSAPPLLLGLFRTHGSSKTTLLKTELDEFPSIKLCFNASEDSKLNNTLEQWGNAMKLMAECGLPQMRFRPFESKTLQWIKVNNKAPVLDDSGSGSVSGPGLVFGGDFFGLGRDADTDSLINDDEVDDNRITWWQLFHGAIFQPDENSPEAQAHPHPGESSESLVYEEESKPDWTWLDIFSQLFHSDNTLAITTVLGCNDESTTPHHVTDEDAENQNDIIRRQTSTTAGHPPRDSTPLRPATRPVSPTQPPTISGKEGWSPTSDRVVN